MPSRRPILPDFPRRGVLILLGASAAMWVSRSKAGYPMIDDLWNKWQQDWRRMENLVRRRGWDIMQPLSIAPPASAAEIDAAVKEAGVAVPQQFREVLARCSAAVRFGWYVPMHHAPME